MSLTPYAALHARILSRMTVAVCGVSVFGISSLSALGYLLGVVGLYQWGGTAIGMAPNTTLCLQLSGLALSVLASSDRVWKCSS